MKILFIVGSLNTGGAEKVLVNYINELSTQKDVKVSLFVISLSGNLLGQIRENIEISYLYKGNDQIRNWGTISRLLYKVYRRILKELCFHFPRLFSLIFSKFKNFDCGFIFVQDLFWFSKTNFGKRKYLWIQNNLNLVKDYELFQDVKFAQGFEKIVAISDGIYEDLTLRIGISSDSIIKINNPINTHDVNLLAQEKDTFNRFDFDFHQPYMVTMGRLIHQKGFDILMKAFCICKKAGRLERLVIVGGGEEHDSLIKLASDLGLVEGEDYLITGIMSNPYPLLKNAKLFVCSSRFDGLSTSINEAMSLGLPIVSTPCDFGPKEILGDSKYGIISEGIDEISLSNSIQKMFSHIAEDNCFSDLSVRRSQDFDIKHISKLLIQSIK